MSLRQKTIALFSFTLLALFIILYGVSRSILLQSYEELEKNRTQQNVQRLLNSVNNALDSLRISNADYAFWDDTYAYVEDRNSSYIDDNYFVDTYLNLGINFVIILDSEGNRIFDKTLDLSTESEIPFPTGLEVFLSPSSPFIRAANEKNASGGLVVINGQPMLLTAQPILTSLHEGPSTGTMIFGRFFDDGLVQNLSKSIELPVRVSVYNAPEMPTDIADAVTMLSVEKPSVIRTLNNNTIAGYGLMNDITGRPALVLRVTMPRDIYAQGEASLLIFLSLLVGAGVVFGIVTLLLLERTVLSRLTALNSNLNAIRTSGSLSARVNISGEDEIASLGQTVNGMLAGLEENQQHIRAKDQQLETLVRNAPIMLWAVNADHRITLLEGSTLNLLKLGQMNPVGKPVNEVFGNIPEFSQTTQKALQGEQVSAVIPVENYVFEVRYTTLKNADGKISEVVGVATDITERTQAEQALNKAYHDLERQTAVLERAQLLYNSTLDHLVDSVQRGSHPDEIQEYLDFMRKQFQGMNRQETM